MGDFVLALDQGTTSSRAIIFDHQSRIVSISQVEFRQLFPKAGYVEHDPEEIWESQAKTAVEAVKAAGLSPKDIAAIGLTNQRETTVVWNRETGEPVGNAIVWQDRRTAHYCDELRSRHGDLIREKTGLETDAYFSASKLNWILRNNPQAAELARSGLLCFGTIDSWLVWKLTGGELHLTDVSNASRTLLFNIHSLCWDEQLLELFEIPPSVLPEVKSSSEPYGRVTGLQELEGVPVAGIAGDQQAAMFGQLCIEPGDTKNTYGTGCFALQNTGYEPSVSDHHLLSTVAWQIDGKTTYALEGSVFIGGAVIQWLRDSLKIIEDSSEVEDLARAVPDNGGVFFVPAFAGLGTPYWDQGARGTIVGLTRGSGREHIARAAIESIAFQTAELIRSLENDSGRVLEELRVDGGATKNSLLLQFQADLLGIPIVVPETTETTALGAAYLAGLAVGFWKDTADLRDHSTIARRFEPKMPREEASQLMNRWQEAVERSRAWVTLPQDGN